MESLWHMDKICGRHFFPSQTKMNLASEFNFLFLELSIMVNIWNVFCLYSLSLNSFITWIKYTNCIVWIPEKNTVGIWHWSSLYFLSKRIIQKASVIYFFHFFSSFFRHGTISVIRFFIVASHRERQQLLLFWLKNRITIVNVFFSVFLEHDFFPS